MARLSSLRNPCQHIHKFAQNFRIWGKKAFFKKVWFKPQFNFLNSDCDIWGWITSLESDYTRWKPGNMKRHIGKIKRMYFEFNQRTRFQTIRWSLYSHTKGSLHLKKRVTFFTLGSDPPPYFPESVPKIPKKN